MDSLSQLTLGAAVGELVLGRKLGNRAMVWGAIAGTIPDLDVVGNYFMSDLDGLLFHRGISHSIFFSVIGSILFGLLIYTIYNSPYHKWIATVSKVLSVLLILKVVHFLASIFNFYPIIVVLLAAPLLFAPLYYSVKTKYFSSTWEKPEASKLDWINLFFWAFATHILLDCFTLYGTQVFAPFSNYKVMWGSISVVDPLYTLPLLVLLICASRFNRSEHKRRILNNTGLLISSLYLMFTVYNRHCVYNHFQNEFTQAGLEVYNYSISAVLFSNVLWSCTAETNDFFYIGDYSQFDEVPVSFYEIEKNHQLLKNIDADPTIQALRWFSDDYFCITESEEGLLFNDLRFGMYADRKGKPAGFIFSFLLIDQGDDGYLMKKTQRGPNSDDRNSFFSNLWKRIKGKK